LTNENWSISVERPGNGEVSFEVTVPEADVESHRKQAINELKQEVEISGFRKGKVPDSIIEKRRPQQVQQALIQRLVPEVCRQVYEEHEIQPIQNPEIEDFDVDGDFYLKASVLEQPRVDVNDGEYRGIEVEIEDQQVSDEDVESRIDEIRSSQASLEPIPIARSVEEGDFVDIDFQGFDDQGKPVEGTGGENKVIEIGSERFLPEIEEGLIGADEGDQRRIEASFPEDFVDDDLAGSTLEFDVNINEIKEERKPDLDSETFLDELDVESADELREQVRDQLSRQDEQQRRDQLSEQIYDFLLEHYDFTIPETLIEDEIDTIIDDYRRQVESHDRDFEEFLEQQDQSLEELRDETRPEAKQRIKLTLIFQAMADEENIEVTDEEFREHVEELSDQTGMEVSAIEDLPDEQQQSLRYQYRDDKVLDFLIEQAEVEEIQSSEESEADSENEEETAGTGS